MNLDLCAGDQEERASPSLFFYAPYGFIKLLRSYTVPLMKYFVLLWWENFVNLPEEAWTLWYSV